MTEAWMGNYTQTDITGKEWDFCELNSYGLGRVSAADSCKKLWRFTLLPRCNFWDVV